MTGTPLHLDRHSLPERLADPAFDPAGGSGTVLSVDKPVGWTSFDVVAFVRARLRVKKVGHAGTLDPMATGLLIILLGPATRLADSYQAEQKEYTGTLRLGSTTPSDDADTEPDAHFPTEHITPEMVREGMAGLTGEILQTPPMYSARKVGGRRLYTLARRGETIEREARPVTIEIFEAMALRLPDEIDFRVVCSKGTYIRTLARDLGTALASGAHLTALRRTASGGFRAADAATIEMIRELRPGPRDAARSDSLQSDDSPSAS